MIEGDDDYRLTAVREAKEEAGLIIDAASVHLHARCFSSPGLTDEASYLCYAQADLSRVDVSKQYGCPDENEVVTLETLPLARLDERLRHETFSTATYLLLTLLSSGLLRE